MEEAVSDMLKLLDERGVKLDDVAKIVHELAISVSFFIDVGRLSC